MSQEEEQEQGMSYGSPVQQKRLNQRRKEVSTPYPKTLQLWASQTVV